ncbi:hypothetical protein A0H81_04291 [Grifola frondosa]|uniref:Uncharacterized protein n=1 Tax=Grifola frondosa TaxID=5627 RepID=A0A1C7MG29_GRIFR|nr:hypothetical protein A0H81_04291 [Grifola frondosa]
MITHRGFSAWITCEDRPIAEYEAVLDAKSNKVSCWIPSQTEKPFVVHWRDHGSNLDTATYIHLDGYRVPGQFLYGEGEELRRGVRVGNGTERPLFSRRSKVKKILLVYKPNKPLTPPNLIRGHRQAGDVCVRFGVERPSPPQKKTTWKIEPYEKDNPGVYVSFVFRYRSREWLVSQGIMSSRDPDFDRLGTPTASTPTTLNTPPPTPAQTILPPLTINLGRISAPGSPTPSPSPNIKGPRVLSRNASFKFTAPSVVPSLTPSSTLSSASSVDVLESIPWHHYTPGDHK